MRRGRKVDRRDYRARAELASVGYGDLYPGSVGGRLIGIVVMLIGIGFLSVLTATMASHFVKTERGSETAEIISRLERIERGPR